MLTESNLYLAQVAKGGGLRLIQTSRTTFWGFNVTLHLSCLRQPFHSRLVPRVRRLR